MFHPLLHIPVTSLYYYEVSVGSARRLSTVTIMTVTPLCAALFSCGMHTLTLNLELPERPPHTRSRHPWLPNLVKGRHPPPSYQVLEIHVPSICVSMLLSLSCPLPKLSLRSPLDCLSQFECSL